MAELPLAGRRIAVTRPRGQVDELAEELERRGARVLTFPLIAIGPPPEPGPLADAAARLDDYDWIVFTSANGVAALLQVAPDLRGTRIAAVGPATAAAVRREAGVEPAFVPERFAAEEIAAGLEPVGGATILLPQADLADPALALELRERGAAVDAVTAYATVAVERSAQELHELRTCDAVVLASGSAARSLAAQGGAGGALAACIGPKTAEVASEVGLEVGIVAREATGEGIIQALVSHFQDI